MGSCSSEQTVHFHLFLKKFQFTTNSKEKLSKFVQFYKKVALKLLLIDVLYRNMSVYCTNASEQNLDFYFIDSLMEIKELLLNISCYKLKISSFIEKKKSLNAVSELELFQM